MCPVVANAKPRFAFNAPTGVALDLPEAALPIMMFLSPALTQAEGGRITVVKLTRRLPSAARRASHAGDGAWRDAVDLGRLCGLDYDRQIPCDPRDGARLDPLRPLARLRRGVRRAGDAIGAIRARGRAVRPWRAPDRPGGRRISSLVIGLIGVASLFGTVLAGAPGLIGAGGLALGP
jgi:hypothetical protein